MTVASSQAAELEMVAMAQESKLVETANRAAGQVADPDVSDPSVGVTRRCFLTTGLDAAGRRHHGDRIRDGANAGSGPLADARALPAKA